MRKDGNKRDLRELNILKPTLFSSSVADPDPDWIRIQSGPLIRIQGQESEEDNFFNIKKKIK
jgi:hypothetical protein